MFYHRNHSTSSYNLYLNKSVTKEVKNNQAFLFFAYVSNDLSSFLMLNGYCNP